MKTLLLTTLIVCLTFFSLNVWSQQFGVVPSVPDSGKAPTQGQQKPKEPITIDQLLPILHDHFDEQFIACVGSCPENKGFEQLVYTVEVKNNKLEAFASCKCPTAKSGVKEIK
jgi:hypothetical protein